MSATAPQDESAPMPARLVVYRRRPSHGGAGLPKWGCFLATLLWLLGAEVGQALRAQGPFPMDPSGVPASSAAVFPENRPLRRLLRSAEQAVEEKNFAEAVGLLSRVLAHPEDFFYRPRKDAATYVSLKSAARQMLLKLPPEAHELFRLRFEGEAKRLLRQGLEQDRPELLAQAARRYFLTRAGARATWHLVRRHLDSGQVLAAGLLLDQMAQLPEKLRNEWEPDLSLLRAGCYLQQGQAAQAQKLLLPLKQRFPDLQLALATGPIRLWELNAPARQQALVQLVRRGASSLPPERFWPYPGGTPQRVAAPAPAIDLVLRRWRAEFYDEYFDPESGALEFSERGLVPLLNRVVAQAIQQGRGIVAGEPLIAGDVVVVRTLTQLIAVETETGRRLWEHSRDEIVLPLLARLDGRIQQPVQPFPGGAPIPAPGGVGNAIPAQLFSRRLFADRTYQTLSTDGVAVFCVERIPIRQSPPAPARPPFAPQVPPMVRQWFVELGALNRNRLAAYELRTGKLLWQLGEADARLAAGQDLFFLGPPLPLDDTLYVLAENRGEIRLLALEAAPGHRTPPRLVWAQPLGHADVELGRSLRPFSGLSPTFAQGLLLCPTDAGVLVALEPVTRQLRWGFVYRASGPRRRPYRPPQASLLNNWVDSLVRVYGSYAVFTPRDEPWLYCLDVSSGRLLWKLPRGDSRLVLSLSAEGVLLQGDRSLRLMDWQGRTRWSMRFASRGTSVGRALVTERFIHVPLSDGTLLAVDRRTGTPQPEATLQTRSASDPFAQQQQIELGSFVSTAGVVLCLGPFGLERLENVQQLQARLARRLQQHPEDVDTLLLAAGVQRRLKQWDGALELLQRAYDLDPAVPVRQALAATLLEALEADFPRYRRHLPQLRRLLKDPQQRARMLRICALGYQRQEQTALALEHYLELLALPSLEEQLQQVEPDRWVRQRVWVLSQLNRLGRELSGPEREKLGQRLQQHLRQLSAGPELLQSVLQLLGQEDQLPQLRRRWIEQAAAVTASQCLRRDYHLLRLAEAPDRALAGWATATLAREYRRLGLTEEAAWFYRLLKERFADVECLDGKTGSQLVAELKPDEAVHRRLHWNGWPNRALKLRNKQVSASGRRGQRQREYVFGPLEVVSQEPWAGLIRFQVEWGPGQRLVARNRFGRVLWTTQLLHPQTRQILRTYPGTVLAQGGHVLVLATADSLVAVDLMGSDVSPPGQILWMQPFLTPRWASLPHAHVRMVETWYPWGQKVRAYQAPGVPSVVLRGVVAGPRVFFQQDDALVALDLFTGHPLWRRTGFVPGCNIFADREHVMIGPVKWNKTGRLVSATFMLLDAQDGSVINPQHRVEVSSLTVRGLAGLSYSGGGPGNELAYVDLLTRRKRWQLRWPPHTTLCLRHPYLMGLTPERELTIVHVPSGKVIAREKLPLPREERVGEIDFLAHSDAWVLLVNTHRDAEHLRNLQRLKNGQAHLIGRQLLHGQLVVLDRTTGKLRWWRPVENLILAPYQAPDHPLLVLGNSQIVRRRVGPGRVQLQMVSDFFFLDKRTGKLLWDVQVNNRRNPWFDPADMANPLAGTIRWRNGLLSTTWEFDPKEPPPKGESTPLAPRPQRPQQPNLPPGPGPNPNPLPPRR